MVVAALPAACSAEMLEMYKGFVENYGVISIEDPYEQDDWDNWKAIVADVPCQIVGDDHLVTNPTRIKKSIEEKSANALLLKVRGAAAVHSNQQFGDGYVASVSDMQGAYNHSIGARLCGLLGLHHTEQFLGAV